jgi:PAS domain S-box-containing protein
MSPESRWLKGNGELATLIRGFDWAATPLGPLRDWPHTLKTITSFMLQSPVPMVLLWGTDGIMIFNDAYSVFAGSGHAEKFGRPVLQAWPEVADFNRHIMQVGLAGGTLAYKDQELTLHRNGRAERAWMNLDYSPVLDEDGQAVGVVAVVVETTDRVLADRRIAADLQRQRDLFRKMPGFVAILAGPDHTYEYVNDAYVDITGRTDFVGHTVRDMLPELEGQGFFELLDGVYRTGERVVSHGMELRLGSSEVQFITFVYEPIHDDQGAVTGIFVGGYEATDAYRSAAALRASEAQLKHLNETLEERISERTHRLVATEALIQTFFDHSSECHAILTEVAGGDFRYEEANPTLLRLYGKTRDQVIGWTTSEIFGEETGADVNRHLSHALAGGVPYRYERQHGAGLVEAVATPVLDGDGAGRRLIVSARDVTERRALEEQLRQSQKMEAVGQLTGGIAHDFNNLLTGITGSLDLIGKRISEGHFASVPRYIEMAQTSARRAAALTQRLLAFSRRQALDPKPTDVNRLVAGMEDLIRRTVGPGVAVEVVGAGGLWLTQVDPSQLESALLNLAINARDAMPDGGRITIETANKWFDYRVAKDRDLPPGQYIALCVTDTGTGMTPDVISRAFDPFFTTKPLGQGTGLGLSMIHGFVRQSGGQVRIYSEIGKGTTMSLYLPRFTGDIGSQETPQPETGVEAAHGETVLVVDDEEIIRMMIVDVLEEAGYRILEAADGPAAVKILQSNVRIDLVITDVGLPGGVNGRQLADAGRSVRPNLKVLFVTGYAENAIVGNGTLDAGMKIITKPFEMTTFASRVQEIIES